MKAAGRQVTVTAEKLNGDMKRRPSYPGELRAKHANMSTKIWVKVAMAIAYFLCVSVAAFILSLGWMLTEDLKEDGGDKCCRDASVFRMQDAGGEGGKVYFHVAAAAAKVFLLVSRRNDAFDGLTNFHLFAETTLLIRESVFFPRPELRFRHEIRWIVCCRRLQEYV
ncbi:hypothetical protein INR49_003661 [Caranx melampygus]|nr:hypothetical protein INR49_003661 [Caranx melampygus]